MPISKDARPLVYDRKRRLIPLKKPLDELVGTSADDMRATPCFCGASAADVISNTSRHGTELLFVRCSACGTIRIDPYLTDEALDAFYRNFYRNTKHKNRSPEATWAAQVLSSQGPFDFVKPHLGADGTVLDYGCAAGGAMAPFLDHGYRTAGFDLDERFVSFAVGKGVDRFDPGARYDLIFLSHVVEHMNTPVTFIRELLSKNLADGGLIYINVPLIDRNQGAGRHPYLLAEFHLAHKFYFTSLSIKLLAGLAGLSVVAEDQDQFLFTKSSGEQRTPSQAELMRVSEETVDRARRHLTTWRRKELVRRGVRKLRTAITARNKR